MVFSALTVSKTKRKKKINLILWHRVVGFMILFSVFFLCMCVLGADLWLIVSTEPGGQRITF